MSWPLWCDVRPTPARPLPATPNLLLYISAVTLLYLSIKSFLVSRCLPAQLVLWANPPSFPGPEGCGPLHAPPPPS